jgi:tetratricopeptide (TPR) repeat protein
MYSLFASTAAIWLLLAAFAHAADGFTATPAYEACARLAAQDPAAALQQAKTLGATDPSIGPRHCHAMALYGLGRYQEAGAALDQIRDALPPQEVTLRSYITRQAARAWLEARQPDQALSTLARQIQYGIAPANDAARASRQVSELLRDRANILEENGQTTAAVQDLDHAISMRPNGEDLLLARAALFMKIGDKALAQEDLQRVLRGNPKQPEALAMMRALKKK